MGTWAAESTPELVTEQTAGQGKYGTGVSLSPRETIQFRFSRQDAATEPWSAEIYASLDNVTYGSVPIASARYEVTQLEGTMVITGPVWVKPRIKNVDGTPVDKVSVNISYRKDQVSSA